MTAPRYDIGTDDLLVIDAIDWRCVRTTEDGYVLRSVHDERIVRTFGFEQFERARRRPLFEHHAGHFGEARAGVRLAFDRLTLPDLPAAKAQGAAFRLAVCEAFLSSEWKETAARSRGSMERALIAMAPEIERVFPGSTRPISIRGGGTAVMPTSARNLHRWLARVEPTIEPDPAPNLDEGFVMLADCLSLVDKTHKSGNHLERYVGRVKDIVSRHVNRRVSLLVRADSVCHREMASEIAWENRRRVASGEKPFETPSVAFVRTLIRRHPEFNRIANGKGLGKAIKSLRPVGRGLDVSEPLERVEMDGWQAHVMSWLSRSKPFALLSKAARLEVERMRPVLVLAADRHSTLALGAVLAATETAEATLATLRMMHEDKAALSAACGAKNPWTEHGRARVIVTDMGAGFIDARVKRAAASLGSTYLQPPGGQPALRAIVEGFNHRIDDELMPYFLGRTFSGVEERDGRDPVAEASAFLDTLAKCLVIYLTDIHAETPTMALGGRTPRQVFTEGMAKRVVKRLPPTASLLRNVFGTDRVATLTARGLRHDSIFYHSDTLAQMFTDRGGVEIPIRVDDEDIGVISAKLDDGRWISVPAVHHETYDGMPRDTWDGIRADIRRRYAENAAIKLADIWEARKRIEAEAGGAREIAKIIRLALPEKTLARARHNLFVGFRLAEDHEASLESGMAEEPELEFATGGEDDRPRDGWGRKAGETDGTRKSEGAPPPPPKGDPVAGSGPERVVGSTIRRKAGEKSGEDGR